ncbi:MAG: PLDc N-terminal domain-containing protein [Rhodobacterales bacterium]|nr:PLDc N-terminal domain-containing protein [Rhodobacterales bacterium]
MIMNFASNLWDFMIGAFIIFLFIMWIWLLISVFSDLFRRKDMSGLAKVIWIILLLVLPYLGVFAYLLSQGSGMNERDAAAMQATREHLRNTIGFSVADEIAKLEALKAEGKISADEFAKLRAGLV